MVYNIKCCRIKHNLTASFWFITMLNCWQKVHFSTGHKFIFDKFAPQDNYTNGSHVFMVRGTNDTWSTVCFYSAHRHNVWSQYSCSSFCQTAYLETHMIWPVWFIKFLLKFRSYRYFQCDPGVSIILSLIEVETRTEFLDSDAVI